MLYPYPPALLTSHASSSATSRERRQLWLLAIPVTTFCLGTWQVFRLQWKVRLIDDLERRTRKAPIDIPSKYEKTSLTGLSCSKHVSVSFVIVFVVCFVVFSVQEHLEELEYRRVRLRGSFDHTHELYMWPRSRVMEGMGGPQRGSEPGAFVVTPFYCHEIG